MQQENISNYCQHFQYFKTNKKLTIQPQPFCKFCMSTNCTLWLCLHKNCTAIVCGKSNFLHLLSHLEQSKKTKSFHSIFINIYTAQIRCQYCNIEINDLEQLSQDERKKVLLNNQSNNPLKFRFAILPYLQNLGQPKIMGQLEYPEGHRKINRSLVGIFADRQNYSVIPALQFLAHCDFFKQIIMTMRIQEGSNKIFLLLKQLKSIIKSIQQAHQRAIRIDKFMQLMKKIQPKLMSYKRKDPFQTVLELLNILHEYLNFYKVTNVISNFGKDQWDLFYKTKQIETHCPMYDSMASLLTLDYKCTQCGHHESAYHQINYLKLDFPKKKRKNKVIEQQLSEKGYQSPRKNRGKSLMSFILPEEQIPITIPQLLIEFLRQPFHKQKFCPKCKNTQFPMKPGKSHFKKLADVLIFQINRMPKTTDQLNQTNVLLNLQNIDLNPFIQKIPQQDAPISKIKQNYPQKNTVYQFITAVGIQKGVFPIICKSRYNNQFYIIKNQSVQMVTKSLNPYVSAINPYIICFKRVSDSRTQQFYEQIMKQHQVLKSVPQPTKRIYQSLQELRQNYKVSLPDFYHLQLKYGIQLPIYQPLACKHSKVKPHLQRKSQETIYVTEQMYDRLLKNYKGTMFINQKCEDCNQEIQLLNKRKYRQKLLIKQYDQYKSNCQVMVSIAWLKKWSNYLYSNQKPSYFHKGYPFPPPIDNKVLLDPNNKCKSNLVKNKDFKIVNIFIFKILKELYSGGPQIRYKWTNSQLNSIDENKIREIRMQAQQIKNIYANIQQESPKKSIILEKSSSYMDTVNESQAQDDLESQNCGTVG